jgi:hypothetical protein
VTVLCILRSSNLASDARLENQADCKRIVA